MDLESFEADIGYLFKPDPEEDGSPPREFPNSRLLDELGLNFDYMKCIDWESACSHKHTRLCPKDEKRLHVLTKSKDVPDRLFETALRLMADSIVEYHSATKRQGNIHYYPPIVLTFWAGFETFVRYKSELLILTALNLPEAIVHYLRDQEPKITKKGAVEIKTKYQPVLDRYAVFLKYAYGYEVDRGASFWQALVKAKELRDYYTHLDVSEPRVLKASEVLDYIEAVLLGIIIPSSHLQRTLMLGVYWLYDIWTCLYENYEEYSEKPFFIDWHLNEEYLFHCNFDNLDKRRFPSRLDEPENGSG